MLHLAIVFLVIALIAAFLDSQEWQPSPGKGRRYSSLSSSSSPCCLSWGMGSEGGIPSGSDFQMSVYLGTHKISTTSSSWAAAVLEAFEASQSQSEKGRVGHRSCAD